MKKIIFGLCLVVIVMVLLNKKSIVDKVVSKKVKKETIVENKDQPSFNPNVSISKKSMISKHDLDQKIQGERIPATKNKLKKPDPLSQYSRQEINFFKDPIFLVEGVVASHELRKGQEPIANVGGFFVYNSPGEKNLQVIFSPSKGAYGIFTGEIIVNGQFQNALNFLENTPHEILYQNEVTQKIIIRIDHMSDLSSLEDIKLNPGLVISPDLKFSRVRSL